MDDLISRQEAIDALREAENHAFNGFYKGLLKAHKIIADLSSVNSSGDLISRQTAIDAIFSEPLYESGMKKRDADEVVPAIYEKIKLLPSAQPETHEERTKTHACDLISREAILEALMKTTRLTPVAKLEAELIVCGVTSVSGNDWIPCRCTECKYYWGEEPKEDI